MTIPRCEWCLGKFDDYVTYHDTEWGVPVHNDMIHFEFLVLEGAQAGLSWATVLKRRKFYKLAFDNYDIEKIAKYDQQKIQYIIENENVIKNKLKIQSVATNAQKFLIIQQEFGSFDKYIWQFVDNKPVVGNWKNMKEVPAKTNISDALSKDLKKRGFSFVGSTIIYAHLQATGLVNDHTVDCFRYKEILEKY